MFFRSAGAAMCNAGSPAKNGALDLIDVVSICPRGGSPLTVSLRQREMAASSADTAVSSAVIDSVEPVV
jgi:hypothetical protein